MSITRNVPCLSFADSRKQNVWRRFGAKTNEGTPQQVWVMGASRLTELQRDRKDKMDGYRDKYVVGRDKQGEDRCNDGLEQLGDIVDDWECRRQKHREGFDKALREGKFYSRCPVQYRPGMPSRFYSIRCIAAMQMT